MNNILRELMPDVYAGFPAAEYEEHVIGWDGTNPLFDHLVDKVRPTVIFEIGTWLGQSAFKMAAAAKERNLRTAIICIDTWLGSPEHWLTWPNELMRVNGYPQMYRQFLANVIKQGHQDMIVPLPTTSITAAALLRRMNICADLIYIDANHEEDAVRSDIEHYYAMLAAGGHLFGHDLQEPGVRTAVTKFCAERGLNWTSVEAFWIIE
jgi:hypothetical protein